MHACDYKLGTLLRCQVKTKKSVAQFGCIFLSSVEISGLAFAHEPARHAVQRVTVFDNLTFSGPCRELAFPSFLFFANKRLLNHNITTVQVPEMDVCELLCYHEHNCVSINFEDKPSAEGTYSCDLNNSTHGEHGEDLVDAESYFYRGTEVRVTPIFFL